MPPASPADQPRSTLAGIGLIVGTSFLFACLDATAKYLAQTYPVLQVVWGRYVFATAFVLLLMPRLGGPTVLRSQRPWVQIARSATIVLATCSFFTALKYLPLAEAAALGYIQPFVVTALAFLLLKEPVGRRRWTAVAVGFVGVLIILRPGIAVIHWAAFLAMSCALFNGGYHILTRLLARVDSPQTTFAYTNLFGAALLTAIAPFVWEQPDFRGWLGMALTGILGGLGHYLLIHAYRHTSASTLAPFSYTSIVWVTVLGYLVFGEFPDRWTISGGLVIVASGIYVFYREARLRRAA